jgi:release factor glutamine methyltransferase
MVGLAGGGAGYVRGVRLLVLPGVFRPISDSRLLVEIVAGEVRRRGADTSVLDVCTGSGIVAASAARAGASRIVAVDVSRRALLCAAVNGHGRVRPRRGDLLEAVGTERFDVIASNPPYVPCPDEALPTRGLRRAWDAGLDGRVLLDRLIATAPAHLSPGGALIVTHSTIIGEKETVDRMRAAGLEPEVIERVPGELGPLMRSRRDHLVRQGLLAPSQDTEEVLVIRGVMSSPAWGDAPSTRTASRFRRGGRTTTSTGTSTTSSTTRTSTP